MKKFWQGLAKLFTQGAIYAAGHPDQVIGIINEIKAAKG